MDSDGVNVFHAADSDGGIVCVSHDLVFDFLIALDAFFNKHLTDRGKLECIFHDSHKLVLIVRKAAARSAERKRRTKHNRVSDFLCGRNCLGNGMGDDGRQNRLAEVLAKLFEKLSVLRFFNAFAACA